MSRIHIFLYFILPLMLSVCTPPASFKGASYGYRNSGKVNVRHGDIIDTAKLYEGVKYRSGGQSPEGFDCSGYVRYVYAKNGIILPRTAIKQYKQGKKISLNRAKPGDLLFFRTSGRNISHVGIYLGDKSFIHAPSKGREVSFCDLDNSYWGSRYIGAATYLQRTFN